MFNRCYEMHRNCSEGKEKEKRRKQKENIYIYIQELRWLNYQFVLGRWEEKALVILFDQSFMPISYNLNTYFKNSNIQFINPFYSPTILF